MNTIMLHALIYLLYSDDQIALPTFQAIQKPSTSVSSIASCQDYLNAYPGSNDGVYNIDLNSDGSNEQVYCDMTAGGYTIENAGFADHEESYTGWTMLAHGDYTSAIAGAVSHYYNSNGGLYNLNPGFNSSNCCIISGSQNDTYYGFDNSDYMYPGYNSSCSANCNRTYNDSYIKLMKSGNSCFSTLSQSQVLNMRTSTRCSDNGNPAIFVKRWQ